MEVLTNDLKDVSYLHFVMLVPNIYTHIQINELRLFLNQYFTTKNYGGYEISLLSESDASFMGYCIPIKDSIKDKSILIIDSGKGTTDFSILRFNSEENRIINEYRSGFAGAGQFVTNAVLATFLHHIKGIDKSKINEFYNLILKADEKDRLDLYKTLEEVKTKIEVNKINSEKELNVSTITDLTNLINYDSFSDEFCILDMALNQIESIIKPQVTERKFYEIIYTILNIPYRPRPKFDFVLLTGRASKFTKLKTKIEAISNKEILDTSKIDLKSICLNGANNIDYFLQTPMIGIPKIHNGESKPECFRVTNDIKKADKISINGKFFVLNNKDGKIFFDGYNFIFIDKESSIKINLIENNNDQELSLLLFGSLYPYLPTNSNSNLNLYNLY